MQDPNGPAAVRHTINAKSEYLLSDKLLRIFEERDVKRPISEKKTGSPSRFLLCSGAIDDGVDKPMADNSHMGIVYAVGIGPGDSMYLTPAALAAIEKSDFVTGYSTYLDLVRDILQEKPILESGMRQEVDRCKAAVSQAQQGAAVAVICGGDPGVYSMAGLLIELAAGTGVRVEIVPGVTAATACAALLGAPLMQDFAVISLSDLLTPWEVIEKRLKLAAEADFIIVLYNPKSKGRDWQLGRAREIILSARPAQTVAGFVRSALRGDSLVNMCTLGVLPIDEIDMFTTVVIGNSCTRQVDGRMVTSRGYEI